MKDFLKYMNRMTSDEIEPPAPLDSQWWNDLKSEKREIISFVLAVLWNEGYLKKVRPLGILQKLGFSVHDVMSIEGAGYNFVMNCVVFNKDEQKARELFQRAAQELGCDFHESPDYSKWEPLTALQKLTGFSNSIYLLTDVFSYFDKYFKK